MKLAILYESAFLSLVSPNQRWLKYKMTINLLMIKIGRKTKQLINTVVDHIPTTKCTANNF